MSTATDLWNATLASYREKGNTPQQAWELATVIDRTIYNAYVSECEERKRVRLANIETEAKVAKVRIANAADRAGASGEYDFCVTDSITNALGLNSGAPLSAVRSKLSGGVTLHPGVKQTWTQDAVKRIGDKLGTNYTDSFAKFLAIVPELYPATTA